LTSRLENLKMIISKDLYKKSTLGLLLCSERSGSNLLRCIFDAHPQIFAPNTMALSFLWEEIDKLTYKINCLGWNKLVAETARRINESTFYTGVSVTIMELHQHILVNDIAGLYIYPYLKGLIQYDANFIIIKEHQAWRIAPYFLKYFPKAKIIAQIRDPRDHAVSCKKLRKLYASYHGSLIRALKMWKIDQKELLLLQKKFGKDVVRIHKYEELINNPQVTLKGICKFLNIECSELMMRYYIFQAEKKKYAPNYLHKMWANLDKPLSPKSINQWKNSLKKYELEAIENELTPLMHELGYTPVCSTNNKFKTIFFKIGSSIRYYSVSFLIWLTWVIATQDYSVSLSVILGKAVRAHLPYERFRDRIGYSL